jgi:CheY-like chemotaxis protein
MEIKNNFEVLIVEDSEEMIWAVANVLEKAGFSVDAVTTGKEALKKLEEFPEIKLVVLNYLLPDMNGLTLMEQLRKSGCQVEVVAVSAFGRKEIRDGFMEAGAFAFIEKPFNIRELAQCCKQALGRRHVLPDMPS